jgi:hypothetical protein
MAVSLLAKGGQQISSSASSDSLGPPVSYSSAYLAYSFGAVFAVSRDGLAV